MGLTKLSINRPLTIMMAILGLVLMGYIGYTNLNVDRMPKVDIPYVTVVVIYPGASPDDVAGEVLEEIEDAVAGVAGIEEMTSRASENLGTVTIEFSEGIDGNQAAMDVSREIEAIKGNLPADAEDPTIIKADLNATPIMQIVLSGPQGQDALYTLADKQLKPYLQAVSGVASVSVVGGRDSEIQINPDPIKMSAYNLSLSTVEDLLLAENANVPAGNLEQANSRTALRTIGEFSSTEDIENIVVAGRPNQMTMLLDGVLPETPKGMDTGGLVRLRDMASVSEGYADTAQMVRYNGQEAVLVTVVKTSDGNAIAVADEVKEALALFEAQDLPTGATLDIVIDDTTFTRESVAAVQEDLLLAVVITGVIMLLFLHTINSSLIVMLSVPTSLIVTFLAMSWFGFSLNMMTLIALTLVIAIVVDDSIVVLENVERHLHMGKTPIQAAIDGRSEIGTAAITITLVIVVVYLPVAFMSGIVGQFFREYGITVAVATLLSLLVSFTLTPMLAAYWLKGKTDETQPRSKWGRIAHRTTRTILWPWYKFIGLWEALFTGLANLYAAILRVALKNVFTQIVVVVISAVALVAGLSLITGGFIPGEMLPQEDDGQINITMTMPIGTNLDSTDNAARRAESIMVDDIPELAKVVTQVGVGGGSLLSSGNDQPNSATFTLKLVDKANRERSTAEIVEELRPALQQVPSASFSLSLNSAVGSSSASQLRFLGPDNDTLVDLAAEAEEIIKSVPGVVDLSNDGAERSPETQLIINRQRTTDLGMVVGQVGADLRTAVNGKEVGTFKANTDNGEMDIILRLDEENRTDLARLMQLPLGYYKDQQISLGQVAEVSTTQAPGNIERLNRQPSLMIEFGVDSSYGAADVANAVEATLREQLDFPAGYDMQYGGSTEAQRDSFSQLAFALLLSVVLIYMLLVALYENLLQPLAILFSLPVALVGALGGLYLTGNSLNIMSLLGLVMLVGIVAKNAILLVDYANTLREEHGYTDVKAALVEAGRVRLRPILMTVFAIVFALLPLLFGTGAGAEIRAPIAAVLIGGNISSTLLTLLLVPVMYYFFDWITTALGGLRRRFSTPAEAAPQPNA